MGGLKYLFVATFKIVQLVHIFFASPSDIKLAVFSVVRGGGPICGSENPNPEMV